jgi:TolA-binding protein
MTAPRLHPLLKRPSTWAAVAGLVLLGGTVIAQAVPVEPIQWDRRRLEQLDRNVRRLERAITQRNAAGQPVLVEPDPEVVTLQGRVDTMSRRLEDLENTVQRVNGDLERLTFALDEAQSDNTALRDRLTDADTRLREIEAAAEAERELTGPIAAGSPTGTALGDLAAAVRLLETDAARGERALQVLVVTYPDTPQAREANSRLGDLRVADNDKAGAVPLYAAALRDWPTIAWAGDTTLKLADALVSTDRRTQACGALGEFTRRYAQGASAPLRTRATQLRTRANCG